MGAKKRIVILISGRGSNMQALAEADIAQAEIVAVISNRADAAGLLWAAQHGLTTEAISHHDYPGREAFDAALIKHIDAYQPDLVVLAGFMRILTPEFCKHYTDRLINIHPSLLPAFTGLHTHQRALDSGCRVAGCTIHFVTAELDCGPIIAQGVVPVLNGDTADTLAQRVLKIEHQLLPKAVADFVAGNLVVEGNRVKNLADAATDNVVCLKN